MKNTAKYILEPKQEYIIEKQTLFVDPRTAGIIKDAKLLEVRSKTVNDLIERYGKIRGLVECK